MAANNTYVCLTIGAGVVYSLPALSKVRYPFRRQWQASGK